MSTLAELLVKNQNNLDRMRARLRYLRIEMADYERDVHRLYGPNAEYWSLWYDCAEDGRREFYSDVVSTKQFVDQLREYVHLIDNPSLSLHKDPTNFGDSPETILSLAYEMCDCEADMLTRMDERIVLLRDTADRIRCTEIEE